MPSSFQFKPAVYFCWAEIGIIVSPWPPRDSSFTWSGVGNCHWSLNESCSTTLWHVFYVIYSYPGSNIKLVSLIFNNISYDNLIQTNGCWAWPSSAAACYFNYLDYQNRLLFNPFSWHSSILQSDCKSLDFLTKIRFSNKMHRVEYNKIFYRNTLLKCTKQVRMCCRSCN